MSLHQHVILREIRTRSVRSEKYPTSSSVKPAKKYPTSSTVNAVAEIERRRVASGLSIPGLCAAASVSPATYERIKAGITAKPFLSTLKRLTDALTNAQPQTKHGAVEAFRFVLKRVCERANYTYETVAETDFTVQRPLNKEWLAHAHLRRLAIYITVTEVAQPPTHLARALGISRQAVHQAVDSVAQKRSDEPPDLIDQVRELMAAHQ